MSDSIFTGKDEGKSLASFSFSMISSRSMSRSCDEAVDGLAEVLDVFRDKVKVEGGARVRQYLSRPVEDGAARREDFLDAHPVLLGESSHLFTPQYLKVEKAHEKHDHGEHKNPFAPFVLFLAGCGLRLTHLHLYPAHIADFELLEEAEHEKRYKGRHDCVGDWKTPGHYTCSSSLPWRGGRGPEK